LTSNKIKEKLKNILEIINKFYYKEDFSGTSYALESPPVLMAKFKDSDAGRDLFVN